MKAKDTVLPARDEQLTLICLVDYAILIYWTSPFLISGVPGVFVSLLLYYQ